MIKTLNQRHRFENKVHDHARYSFLKSKSSKDSMIPQISNSILINFLKE